MWCGLGQPYIAGCGAPGNGSATFLSGGGGGGGDSALESGDRQDGVASGSLQCCSIKQLYCHEVLVAKLVLFAIDAITCMMASYADQTEQSL